MRISCYFQRLAIFYNFFKKFIEKVKGVEVGQTLLWWTGVNLRFSDTSLKRSSSLSRTSCYFQRLAIFYHSLKNIIEKVKGEEVGQPSWELSGVHFRFFDTSLKKLLWLARISCYFQRLVIFYNKKKKFI